MQLPRGMAPFFFNGGHFSTEVTSWRMVMKKIIPGTRLRLTLLSLLLLGGLCVAQPAVKLSATVGPPTTNLLVSGSGFSAFVAIDIYFDTTDLALVTTDATGAFSQIGI